MSVEAAAAAIAAMTAVATPGDASISRAGGTVDCALQACLGLSEARVAATASSTSATSTRAVATPGDASISRASGTVDCALQACLGLGEGVAVTSLAIAATATATVAGSRWPIDRRWPIELPVSTCTMPMIDAYSILRSTHHYSITNPT